VITQRILSQTRPGAIILSHDIHKQTVDAMPATLDALIAKGYKFVTVSQLIAMNKPKPTPAETADADRPHSPKGRKAVSADTTPSGTGKTDTGSAPSPTGERP
jgi:peptidoglycan-N-acetylglucosamine deacetylase